MAHLQQERWSAFVDAKLRATLVHKDGVIFNNRHEGNPKAGLVKVPVRDTEVTVGNYSKTDGASKTHGSTAYIDMLIDKDKAVNEVIDGFDAAAVPDNLVADRLDSAGYSLGKQTDTDAVVVLEAAATTMSNTVQSTSSTAYDNVVAARTLMTKAFIPNDGQRFLLVSADFYALLLKDTTHFIRSTQMGDDVVQTGVVGKIANFLVIEDPFLSDGVEFLAGHPDWCSRVNEWQVPVHLQDLSGSGTYIGASAVQGRRIYAHKVTRSGVLFKKAFTPDDYTEISAAAWSVTAPVKSATPQSTFASGTGYTGAIAWSGSPSTFAGSTAYTATVTLTAATGYEFAPDFGETDITGLPASGVTVTRTSDTVVTIAAVYAATAA